jgi:hypothetical protein
MIARLSAALCLNRDVPSCVRVIISYELEGMWAENARVVYFKILLWNLFLVARENPENN